MKQEVRFQRAIDLAEALHREIVAYRQSDGPRVVVSTNVADTAASTIWWEWHFEKRQGWPADWAVKLAEVMNHFRALLDGAVWELAKAHAGGRSPKGQTKFPICDHANRWDGDRAAIRRLLPAEAIAVIERHQPYNDSSFLPFDLPPWMSDLTMLQKVTNTDKHREVHLVTESVLNVDRDASRLPDGGTVESHLDDMSDGALVMRVEYPRADNSSVGPPVPGPVLEPAVKVASTGETYPIVWLMHQLAQRVSLIVTELEAQSPSTSP